MAPCVLGPVAQLVPEPEEEHFVGEVRQFLLHKSPVDEFSRHICWQVAPLVEGDLRPEQLID